MSEINENLERIQAMAGGDAQWDFSENDIRALKWALQEIDRLRAENEKLRRLARAVLSAERKMDKRHDDVIASWPSLLCMAREVLGE